MPPSDARHAGAHGAPRRTAPDRAEGGVTAPAKTTSVAPCRGQRPQEGHQPFQPEALGRRPCGAKPSRAAYQRRLVQPGGNGGGKRPSPAMIASSRLMVRSGVRKLRSDFARMKSRTSLTIGPSLSSWRAGARCRGNCRLPKGCPERRASAVIIARVHAPALQPDQVQPVQLRRAAPAPGHRGSRHSVTMVTAPMIAPWPIRTH
jgi:hypothetical protein